MSGADEKIRSKQKERATRYGKLERGFWLERRARKRSKVAKLVLVYLHSAPVGRGTSLPGVVRGRAVVLADDVGLRLAEFNKALAELVEAGLVDLSNDDGDLVIVVLGAWFDEDGDAVLMNAPVSISQAVAWVNAIKDLPACETKTRLLASVRRFVDLLDDEQSSGAGATIPNVIRAALVEADGRQTAGSPSATGPLGLGLGLGPSQGQLPGQEVPRAKTRRAKTPQPSTAGAVASGHRVVIDHFCGLYQAQVGAKYDVSAADGAHVKALLKKHSADEINGRAELMFSGKTWIKPPYSISNLRSQWNSLVVVGVARPANMGSVQATAGDDAAEIVVGEQAL